MKKLLAILGAGLLLASCSSGGEGDDFGGTTDTPDGQSGSEDEITLWVQFSEESAEGQVMVNSIKEFNETNENGLTAKVNYIPRSGSGGGYEDVLNAALTTDTLPDVLTLDGPNTAAYADSGMIKSLEGDINDVDDLLPSIIEQGTYEDELYAVGFSESSVGIFYNEDMLEEAGIDLDSIATIDDPWNWNEFNDVLQKLYEYYGEKPILDMGFDDHSEWLLYGFTPFVWSAGGNIVNETGTESVGYLNSEESVAAFEFIQNLVKNNYASITPVDNGFHTGEYALYMSGSWTIQELEAEYQDINYGVMPLPVSPETGELASPTGSWAYGMSTSTKNPEGALELINFLTSTEQLYNMSMGNAVLPARQSSADLVLEEVGEPMRVLIEQNTASGIARPVLKNYPQVSRAFQEAITEATYYEETDDISELLKRKAEEIEGYLE